MFGRRAVHLEVGLTKRLSPLFALVACTTIATAENRSWWHGSFIFEGSGSDCDSSDTLTTYKSGEVYPWETECKIQRETKINGMDGILLDLECTFPDEPESSYKERQLLLKIDDQTIFRYPDSRRLKRCPLETTNSNAKGPAPSDCDWNSKLWLAEKENAVHQELRFTDGVSSGAVHLREYRNGKPAWVSTGTFGCSNGASVCYLELPATHGKGESLPFEILTTGDGSEYLIIPSLSQTYYYISKGMHTASEYGGVQVEWQPGFSNKEWEVTLPSNVYQYRSCSLE